MCPDIWENPLKKTKKLDRMDRMNRTKYKDKGKDALSVTT